MTSQERAFAAGEPQARSRGDFEALLDDAGAVLASSLDAETTMADLARLVVPCFAELCFVDVADESGVLRRAAVASAGLELAADDLAASEHRAPRSCLVVPLARAGRPLGAITFVGLSSEGAEPDPDLAAELGRLASIALDTARVYQDEKRARERIAHLQAFTSALAKALVPGEVADAATRFGVEAAGAECGALWALESDRTLRLLGSHGLGSEREQQWKSIALASDSAVARAIRIGYPQWIVAADESLVIAPLAVVEGRVAGAIAFVFPGSRPFATSERVFLATLAEQCGQALERARLFAAERRTAERLGLLARAGEALSLSLDYEMTLRSICRLLVPELADWCTVDVFEGSELLRVAVVHRDPDKEALGVELGRAYPNRTADDSAVGRAVRTGRAQLSEHIADEDLASMAKDAEHLRLLRDLGLRSCIVAPLSAHGEALGVVSVSIYSLGRAYDRADLDLIEEIGRRAGLAVANARLFACEARARERMTDLQQMTSSLARAATVGEVARAAVHGASLIEGSAGLLYATDPDGSLRLLAEQGTGIEPRRVISAASALPEASCARGRNALWIESLEQLRREYPHTTDDATGPYMQARAYIPLLLRDRVAGVLAYAFATDHVFRDEDKAFMLTLADHCAQALERSSLLDAAQAAALQAEEANRIKDEFLATVSHELRTPLMAITGWSAILSRKHRAESPALGKGLDVIHRNALAQAKIIDEILDVSRIVTGKLRIEPEPVVLESIVAEALDVVRPAASAKRVDLRFDPGPASTRLVGDPERLRQVALNLLSNAVKFTDEGGAVFVDVERAATNAVLHVRDTGRGIAPTFLPYVFERFKQADSSTTRAFGGLGLGLAIVRHIVELHGGSVSAQSAGLGLGATFTVLLPIRAVVPPRNPEASQPAAQADRGSREAGEQLWGVRVLVVDDEPDARDLLATVLGERGAVVETADAVPAALDAVNAFHPDVIVSDIAMPGEDGYALVRKLRARGGARIPAVALTAYAALEDRDRALAAGFDVHLAKPIEPQELWRVVGSLVARARV